MAENESPGHEQRYQAEDFTWTANAQPNSPERRELSEDLAAVGWESIFETLPPAVADAYHQLTTNASELIRSLCNPDSDPPEASLVAYTRLRSTIELYRNTFGLWFGLPAKARTALNRHVRHLDDATPYDIADRHRLLRHWQENPNPHDFLHELAKDTGPPIGLTTPHTADHRGADLVAAWSQHRRQSEPDHDDLTANAARMESLWNVALGVDGSQ